MESSNIYCTYLVPALNEDFIFSPHLIPKSGLRGYRRVIPMLHVKKPKHSRFRDAAIVAWTSAINHTLGPQSTVVRRQCPIHFLNVLLFYSIRLIQILRKRGKDKNKVVALFFISKFIFKTHLL